MPLTLSLPAPTIHYDREIWWPSGVTQDRQGTTPGVWENLGYSRSGVLQYADDTVAGGNDTSQIQVLNSGTGGSGGAPVGGMQRVDGIWSALLNIPAASFRGLAFSGVAFRGPLDAAGLNASYINPSIVRVCWVSVAYRWQNLVANPTASTWLGFCLSTIPSRDGSFPTGGSFGQYGGFGFNGDGAGGIAYRTYEQAPAFPGNQLTSAAVPGFIVGEWNHLEFQFICASPTRGASVSAWCNGTLVGNHSFASGDLPVYGVDNVGNPTTRFVLNWQAADQGEYRVAAIHARWGRFTRDGLELQD